MTPGKAIHLKREALSLPISTLASSSGLTPAALSEMEEDKRKVDAPTLYKIAKAMGISAYALLGLPEKEGEKGAEVISCLREYLWEQARERGRRITQGREKSGMNSISLARAIGKSSASVRDYEKGAYLFIPYEVMVSIAREINCSVDWLLGNEDESIPSTGEEVRPRPPLAPWALSGDYCRREECGNVLAALQYCGNSKKFQEKYGKEAWEQLKEGTIGLSEGVMKDIRAWTQQSPAQEGGAKMV